MNTSRSDYVGRVSRILCLGALGFSAVCCATRQDHYVTPVCFSAELTPAQLKDFSAKGEEGSADAAFRLYLYYSQIKWDQASALRWLRKAADLGLTNAQLALAKVYSGEFDARQRDPEKAEYWSRRAAEPGSAQRF
jgi:TPR repeat protein